MTVIVPQPLKKTCVYFRLILLVIVKPGNEVTSEHACNAKSLLRQQYCLTKCAEKSVKISFLFVEINEMKWNVTGHENQVSKCILKCIVCFLFQSIELLENWSQSFPEGLLSYLLHKIKGNWVLASKKFHFLAFIVNNEKKACANKTLLHVVASFFLKLIKFDNTFLTFLWGNNTLGISRAKTWETFLILEKTNHYKKVFICFDLLNIIIAKKSILDFLKGITCSNIKHIISYKLCITRASKMEKVWMKTWLCPCLNKKRCPNPNAHLND